MSLISLKKGETESQQSASTEEVGIGGFMMFARVNDSTDYVTQAPTAVVEDGGYIGDQLINDPIQISISGEVADLFIADKPPRRSEARLPTVGVTTSFIPGRTISQLQAVRRIINSATDRSRLITNQLLNGSNASQFSGNSSGNKSYREQFIDFIESIHYGKQLISISTAFRKHDSMAITSVTITRDNQRKAIAFSLTAKKIRIAKTEFVSVSQFYKKPAPAVKAQTGGTTDKGTQSPTSSDGQRKEKSVLSAVLGR